MGVNKLQFTVLGRYGAYPAAGGACSGYLLQDKGVNLLIDCGSGVFSRMQNYCPHTELDGLIISHFHADHYLDIYPLRYALQLSKFGQRKSKLPVYLPPGGKGELTKIFDPEQAKNNFCLPFQFNEFNSEGLKLKHLKLQFMPVPHPVLSYAIKISSSDWCLAYTGDTGLSQSLVDFCHGVDLLLSEATLLNRDEGRSAVSGHLTAGQAGKLACQAGAKKLILTHFWPEYCLEQYFLEARETYGREPMIAEENKTYYFR